MLTLFPTMDPVIPAIEGLRYIPDFLTQDEHDRLLRYIDAARWRTEWKRRIQPYGETYNSVKNKPMPVWGNELAARLYREDLTPFICDQLLVNEYMPGQGIAPHADYDTFDRTVVSISLGSPLIMDFAHRDTGEKHQIWLEPNSALVMDGEARYRWMHGIAPRKKDQWNGAWFARGRRVSITLRKKLNPVPYRTFSVSPVRSRMAR
jgi:alkylated DNA repair dioxygenase AlkB